MTNVTRFLTHRLKLKVNEAKSAVARPVERKFLGFSFSRTKSQSGASRQKLCCAASKEFGTDATDARNQSGTNAEGTDGLPRGWKGYFGFSQTPSLLQPRSMDTTSFAVHDLEAMETRFNALPEVTPTRS